LRQWHAAVAVAVAAVGGGRWGIWRLGESGVLKYTKWLPVVLPLGGSGRVAVGVVGAVSHLGMTAETLRIL
jgi:hypothetical protein